MVNVLDSWISFGSAFQRTIDRGTKLDNVDDFLVAGTGYTDFRNEYPVVVSKLAGEEVCISTAVQDLISSCGAEPESDSRIESVVEVGESHVSCKMNLVVFVGFSFSFFECPFLCSSLLV